jgi:hypothetical protein
MADLQMTRSETTGFWQKTGQVAVRIIELPIFLIMAVMAMMLSLVRFFRT